MTPMKILQERLQPAMQRGDRSGVAEAIRKLVDLRAPMGDQWQALAGLAVRHGEISLAKEAIDLFVKARGQASSALYLKAALLEQCGAMEEAYALISSLPGDVPNPAGNAYSRGTAALFLGDTDEARAQLERATRLQPQAGHAWLSLAMAVDLASEREVADAILAAQQHADTMPPPQRAAFFHAVGRMHEARAEHEAAFAAFARGAETLKETAPFDPDKDRAQALGSLEGYNVEALQSLASKQKQQTDRTIFVTGMARTGTTLVEQILTSHSAVSHGAEINRLLLIAAEIRGHAQPCVTRYVEARGVDSLTDLWHRWLDERFPGSARVVDKSLTTTRFMGLAAGLLPEAPLIWMTRDPLDTAWSCFRTFLPAGQQWSCDLEWIAQRMRAEQVLLDHWQGVLGDRLLVVPYEELVAEPETWIRRIMVHCGLEEEPQVFSPHETRRTVSTSSVMQVRQPINRKGIGAAEPYREFLEPFLAAYSD